MDSPRLVVAYADHHEYPLPEGHPFPYSKYRAVRESLLDDASVVGIDLVPAPPCDRAMLGRAHDPQYIERWMYGELSPQEVRASGFPWSRELMTRSLASVEATWIAARAALGQGIGCSLAGGTHHAGRARASGYCLFNDLAIVASRLLDDEHAQRVMIVDLDVHQGDGTAELLGQDRRVFTFSMHGRKNFPRVKVPSTLDIDLEDGTGDEEYLATLTRTLPEILERFRPEFILYQAGVDPLEGDRFGRLALSHEGLMTRDLFVFGEARRRRIPIASCQGGGYGKDLARTVLAHANVVRAAARALDDSLIPGVDERSGTRSIGDAEGSS